MALANKQPVVDFYARLEAERKNREAEKSFATMRSRKNYKLQSEAANAKETCMRGLLTKIYRDAIPMDPDYKARCVGEIDQGMYSFIKKRSPDGTCVGYVSEAAKQGSIPAKEMMESVNREVDLKVRKYYEEMTDDTEVDEIKITPQDHEEIMDKISKNMDYQEISSIIEGNVQQTIQTEIARQKAEDEKIEELQNSLANDESVVTEEALEAGMRRAGFGEQEYIPSLFNGIMIDRMNTIYEDVSDDFTDEDVSKQAFVESVEEYTKWMTVSVLNMEKFDKNRLNTLATRYARGEM